MKKALNKVKSPVSDHAYLQIESDLRARIRRGEWKQGVMLPGRRQLAEEYGVAVNTLQRAILVLLDEGVLTSHGGRGTFVADDVIFASEGDFAGVKIGVLYVSESVLEDENDEQNWVTRIIDIMNDTARLSNAEIVRINIGTPGESNHISIKDGLAKLIENHVNAVCLINIFDRQGIYEELINAASGIINIPILYVSASDGISPIPRLSIDNRHLGYQAAEHLIAAGYKELLFLLPIKDEWANERYEGAVAAVRQLGGSKVKLTVYPPNNAKDWEANEFFTMEVRDKIRQRENEFIIDCVKSGIFELTGSGEPRGFIAPYDIMAFTIIKQLNEKGKKLGADYGLVGFDDLEMAKKESLTSLRPPLEDLGENATNLLLKACKGERIPMHLRLYSMLKPRASTVKG